MSNPSVTDRRLTHGLTTKDMKARFGEFWGRVGFRICAAAGCDRPATGLLCGPCYEHGLRNLRQLLVYQQWVEGWEAKERQMSRPAFRGCGSAHKDMREV